MGAEMDHLGQQGWRLYDTRCYGYLAAVEDDRTFVAPFDRTTTWPSAEAAQAVARQLEPGRWVPVDRPQPPVVVADQPQPAAPSRDPELVQLDWVLSDERLQRHESGDRARTNDR